MPALTSQARRVPNAAASQAAATAVQNESKVAPGTRARASCITIAWPNSVASATAIQPMAAATSTSTGRTIMPTRPVTAAATTTGRQEVTLKPGRSQTVMARARAASAQDTSSRTASEGRTPCPLNDMAAPSPPAQ